MPDSAAPGPLADGVWRIPTPMPFRPREVHAYLARLDDGGCILVDGGVHTADAWAALDAGVRAAAGGWEPVRLHLVTHMHMDHAGLAVRIAEACGAPLLMGRLDAERSAHAAAHPEEEAEYRHALLRRAGAPDETLRAVEAARDQAQSLAPHRPADVLLDGEGGPVPGAPEWHWVPTPGHTAGHLSLFRPADATLIAGDAVLPRITPTLGVNRQRRDPVGDYVTALDRLAALRPARVLPGHGDPPAEPSGRIGELRRAAEEETAVVEALLDGAPRTTWDVVDRRYPGRDLPVGARMLALRETLAHLDRLVAAGRARETPLAEGVAGFLWATGP